MSAPNILISGSGIAGSVFASWFLRSYRNANITIVERAPALRLTGASVDIRSSAVDIIKYMNAEQEIRKYSTKEEGIQFVRPNGSAIATLGATGRTDIQSITSEYEIFRGALAKVFIDPVLDNVKLMFDDYVDAFKQSDDGVEVTFAKSKEVKKYDLLVAADGLGSKIRGMMLNAKSRDQIHDEGVHAAYWTVKKDLLNGSRFGKWYSATKGRCLFVRPDPDPAGRSRAILMNIRWKSDVATKERLDNALRDGNDSYKALMQEMFHDAGFGITEEVLKSMHESDDFYCSLFAQVRSPKLFDNRVVLLGDAGYATPGFGTSLAIIGGYVLAGEILKNQGNLGTALQRYEDMMKPFVKEQQGDFPGMQLLNPQSSWGISIRNAVLSFITGIGLDKLVINVSAALGFSEKKLDLPEYPWPAEEE